LLVLPDVRISPVIAAALAHVALSTATRASALGRELPPTWNDPLAIEGHVGLGAPLGLAGLAVDVTPHPWFSLNAGVGRGVDGLQLAAMLRVRPLFWGRTFALGLGGGVSRGDTSTTVAFGDSPELRFNQATWLNAEVFGEMRRGSLHLRPFVGIARRVAYSSCTYDDARSAMPSGLVRPCSEVAKSNIDKYDSDQTIGYTGVAIGFEIL
jgi:hypothetical protein